METFVNYNVFLIVDPHFALWALRSGYAMLGCLSCNYLQAPPPMERRTEAFLGKMREKSTIAKFLHNRLTLGRKDVLK